MISGHTRQFMGNNNSTHSKQKQKRINEMKLYQSNLLRTGLYSGYVFLWNESYMMLKLTLEIVKHDSKSAGKILSTTTNYINTIKK